MVSALSISGLRKTYRNGVDALKGIDLEVPEGDFFALLGPNGAGKSTAIGIVSSLVNKSAGRVRVFGHDLDGEADTAKRFIGLVPQEFNFNVFEPVVEIVVNQAGYYGIPRREAFRQAEKYLRQLGLWGKRFGMARELSGGMKRRLMIARALVHEPRLLILDEPTAGVDIEIRRSMWDFMRRINAEGTTVILTTHYLEEAESLCQNIAIIQEGSIVEHSDMQSLLYKLHSETLVLNLREPLAQSPRIPGYPIKQIGPCSIEVEIANGKGINGLFKGLAIDGVEVVSMRNKENRLEKVFMEMVRGGRCRPAGQDQ